jgi:hypothetical protein
VPGFAGNLREADCAPASDEQTFFLTLPLMLLAPRKRVNTFPQQLNLTNEQQLLLFP